MSVITTGTHPKALWPGVKAWFGRMYDEHPEEFSMLFDGDTSDKSAEEDVLITGFGLAPAKTQGGSAEYDTETQGYVSRLVHVAYALGYIVTHEELRDNLYSEVSKRRAQALAFAMRQTKETVAANVYNRAVTSGYTGGDGIVLLSASHPTRAGNQSNIIGTAADLSEASLEDLMTQIMQATDDRGNKIQLMAQSLHVSPSDYYNAVRIMKSVLKNDTAENAINALKVTGALPKGVHVNHYFSDTDAWFIRTNVPRGMIHYKRDPMEFSQDNDFDTKNAKAMCYERYSFGWSDWRGLYGSMGA